jgi:hypothetical protein
MTLQINDKKPTSDGILVQEVTILAIEDISGTQPMFLKKPCEIGIKVKLDIGKEFQPDFYVTGAFKRDDHDVIQDWGGAFKIRDFFNRLAMPCDMVADNADQPTRYEFPFEFVNGAVGKRFLKLSYVSGKKANGKTRFADWTEIGSVEETPEDLIKRFKANVAKGFPSNYTPNQDMEVADVTEPIF